MERLNTANTENNRLLDDQAKQNMRIKSDLVMEQNQRRLLEEDLGSIRRENDQQTGVYKAQVSRLQQESSNEKSAYQGMQKMLGECKQERDRLKVTHAIIAEKIDNMKKD